MTVNRAETIVFKSSGIHICIHPTGDCSKERSFDAIIGGNQSGASEISSSLLSCCHEQGKTTHEKESEMWIKSKMERQRLSFVAFSQTKRRLYRNVQKEKQPSYNPDGVRAEPH